MIFVFFNVVCLTFKGSKSSGNDPFPQSQECKPTSRASTSTSWHDASRSVGVIISIAQKISIDDIAISSAIERVEGILGEQVHHRILRSYSMLVMFTLKVQICKMYTTQYGM